jgi:hypothetical protein
MSRKRRPHAVCFRCQKFRAMHARGHCKPCYFQLREQEHPLHVRDPDWHAHLMCLRARAEARLPLFTESTTASTLPVTPSTREFAMRLATYTITLLMDGGSTPAEQDDACEALEQLDLRAGVQRFVQKTLNTHAALQDTVAIVDE